MAQLPEEILYDVRLVERHIRNGRLDRAEYEKHLKALEDRQKDVDSMDIEQLMEDQANRG